MRPITIWKGNSYTTISARDPAFSGKDSGKGDSDFNDSDSDVSGDTGLKKDGAVVPPMGGQNGKGRNNGKLEWLFKMMPIRCYSLVLNLTPLSSLPLFQVCGLAPANVRSWVTQTAAGAPQQ